MSSPVVFRRGDLLIDNAFNLHGIIMKVNKSTIDVKWFARDTDIPSDVPTRAVAKALDNQTLQTKTKIRQWIMSGKFSYRSSYKDK